MTNGTSIQGRIRGLIIRYSATHLQIRLNVTGEPYESSKREDYPTVMEQGVSCEISDVLCEVGITIDRIEDLLKLALDSSARRKGSRNEVEIDFYDAVSQFEVLLIKGVLSYTRGNQKRAGQLLGLKPSTLNMKIKAYKLASQELSATRQREETNHAKSEFEGC